MQRNSVWQDTNCKSSCILRGNEPQKQGKNNCSSFINSGHCVYSNGMDQNIRVGNFEHVAPFSDWQGNAFQENQLLDPVYSSMWSKFSNSEDNRSIPHIFPTAESDSCSNLKKIYSNEARNQNLSTTLPIDSDYLMRSMGCDLPTDYSRTLSDKNAPKKTNSQGPEIEERESNLETRPKQYPTATSTKNNESSINDSPNMPSHAPFYLHCPTQTLTEQLEHYERQIDLLSTSCKGRPTNGVVKNDGFLRTLCSVHAIVKDKLYRVRGTTMETYFSNYHHISRAQVYRLLDCHKTILTLSDFALRPFKQRICRILRRLTKNDNELRELWGTVLSEFQPMHIPTLSSSDIVEAHNRLIKRKRALESRRLQDSPMCKNAFFASDLGPNCAYDSGTDKRDDESLTSSEKLGCMFKPRDLKKNSISPRRMAKGSTRTEYPEYFSANEKSKKIKPKIKKPKRHKITSDEDVESDESGYTTPSNIVSDSDVDGDFVFAKRVGSNFDDGDTVRRPSRVAAMLKRRSPEIHMSKRKRMAYSPVLKPKRPEISLYQELHRPELFRPSMKRDVIRQKRKRAI